MYDIYNTPPIIWEKKNVKDPGRLTFWLLVEYSYRLKVANPAITIEEFYDKFNKNFLSKIDRPSYYNHNVEEIEKNELDYDMGWDTQLDDEYSWFAQISTEDHEKYYKILLDKGIII